MAGFKTHIATSTVLGAGYGAAGHLHFGMPVSASLLAAGLCSVSGMLPDLDSDSGVPLRESMAFAAAVTPMLMLDRFRQMGLDNESIVLASAGMYLTIRFVISRILKEYTVHRGMWHSLPAAVIAGLLAFLLCACEDVYLRLFKTGAVMLGFVSHLFLDELYSIQVNFRGIRIKKSFGSAFKLFSNSPWANISTYGKLAVLIFLITSDPQAMRQCVQLQRDLTTSARSQSDRNEVAPRHSRRLEDTSIR